MRYQAERKHLYPTLDKKQAAGILGVTLATIEKWCRDGKLKTVKIGGSTRFVPAEIYEIAGITEPPTHAPIPEDQRIANYVARIVDAMPKLTVDQRATIATALAVTPARKAKVAAQ